MTHRILCAGDRFITPSALGEAARAAFDEPVEVVEYQTEWPDVPFGAVDRVKEASGDPGELAAAVTGCDAVLTHLAPITEGVLRQGDSLKVVGCTRGGPVNVDVAAATSAGIPVVYLPGRNLGAVAEFTIGVMIGLPRSINRSSAALRHGEWDARYFRFELTGPELRAATVGLIGYGAVGRRVATLLTAFGATVLAHDPFVSSADDGVELVSLDELLGRSDIVSLHLRATPESAKMMSRDAFAKMKPGSYLVNTARGELVDQAALLEALERGWLAGAALDVFDPEPPTADDPLLARPDVIPTPHLAGASRQVAVESAERVAREVAAFLRSGELTNCANPEWSQRN
jgi:D-3-phosphoglycerate dehydrogenase